MRPQLPFIFLKGGVYCVYFDTLYHSQTLQSSPFTMHFYFKEQSKKLINWRHYILKLSLCPLSIEEAKHVQHIFDR